MIGKDKIRLNPYAVMHCAADEGGPFGRSLPVGNERTGTHIGFPRGTFAGRALFGAATLLNRDRVIGVGSHKARLSR
jgi:hypothetical protein